MSLQVFQPDPESVLPHGGRQHPWHCTRAGQDGEESESAFFFSSFSCLRGNVLECHGVVWCEWWFHKIKVFTLLGCTVNLTLWNFSLAFHGILLASWTWHFAWNCPCILLLYSYIVDGSAPGLSHSLHQEAYTLAFIAGGLFSPSIRPVCGLAQDYVLFLQQVIPALWKQKGHREAHGWARAYMCICTAGVRMEI